MSKEIRIVIADDHPIFRSGLAQLLKTEEKRQKMYFSSNEAGAINDSIPEVSCFSIFHFASNNFIV